MSISIQQISTPIYHYDTALLRRTLDTLLAASGKYPNYQVHYAIKANANPALLDIIQQAGLGIDCVSGGELRCALDAGFSASSIVFAGVGKSDWEIRLALENEILCLNVESLAELCVIQEIAAQMNRVARVCLRINPDVQAHTHTHIVTGRAEDKFGIDWQDVMPVIEQAQEMPNIDLKGLHFHIGSQILEMDDFKALSTRINEIQDHIEAAGLCAYIHLSSITKRCGEDRSFVCLYDLSPQHTACAELSNFHEVVATDTHIEADSIGCAVVSYACLCEHGHVLSAPCESVCEFLCCIGTRVV